MLFRLSRFFDQIKLLDTGHEACIGHCYHGHITKQGSSWLRWILIEAAIKVVRRDERLAAFYTRLRKRSSGNIARVAVARKLAEICWKRLRRFQQINAA